MEGGRMSDERSLQLGVDVAEGGDQTVVAVRRGIGQMRIQEIVAWTEPNLMKSVERIITIADRYGVTPASGPDWVEKYRLAPRKARGRICVDAIGVGAGVASRLHELKYAVTSFKGNEKAPPAKHAHAME